MDILAALAADIRKGDEKCALQIFLDSIPADQPGRSELIRMAETTHDANAVNKGKPETRSAKRMAVTLSMIGFKIGATPILDHRNKCCRCFR